MKREPYISKLMNNILFIAHVWGKAFLLVVLWMLSNAFTKPCLRCLSGISRHARHEMEMHLSQLSKHPDIKVLNKFISVIWLKGGFQMPPWLLLFNFHTFSDSAAEIGLVDLARTSCQESAVTTAGPKRASSLINILSAPSPLIGVQQRAREGLSSTKADYPNLLSLLGSIKDKCVFNAFVYRWGKALTICISANMYTYWNTFISTAPKRLTASTGWNLFHFLVIT